MKSVTYLLLVSLFVFVSCTNSNFGERTPTSKLVYRDKVFYEAIPWKKRVKNFQYKGRDNLIIKAIYCYDYQNSKASVNITDGGIGFNHVELRLKSEKSYRLDFAIEIYD